MSHVNRTLLIEGFVGFNVEDEDAKMQSSAARKIKKTIKAALDKYPKRVTMTIHT